MRQTQILRVHKRRPAADQPLAEVPVSAVVETSAAAAVIDAIDVLLSEVRAVAS
ncbi:MAG: hypothetical protein ABIM89_01650 [Mycobacteriales bacterium]